MNIHVTQSFFIRTIKVGSISNSAVLQIGTTGSIQSSSSLANTGKYKGPAPQIVPKRKTP